MSYVFISYSRDDEDLAKQLISWLEAHRLPFWWDQMMQPGATFPIALAKALNDASCAIVIWTNSSIKSDHVLDEAERARQARRLIPVAPREFNVNDLPIGFGALQITNIDELDKLQTKLQALGITPPASVNRDVAAPSISTPSIGSVLKAIQRRVRQRVTYGAVTTALALALAAAFPQFALGIAIGAGVTLALILFLTS